MADVQVFRLWGEDVVRLDGEGAMSIFFVKSLCIVAGKGCRVAWNLCRRFAYVRADRKLCRRDDDQDDGVLTVFSGSAAISSPFAPQEQYVTAVYEEVMGQTPDAKGLAYWSQQLDPGAAISSVAKSIAHSDDYFHYLGCTADAGGLSYWRQQFSAGKTNEDLIAGFTGSAEYDKEHTP